MIQLVWIDFPGGGFAATVNLSVVSLDVIDMPMHLEGSFLAYCANEEEAERIVHRQRPNDQSDPVMYFNANRRNGYRFAMQSHSSAHFNAELLAPKAAHVGQRS
jgi:hypothetical protein